MSRLSNVFQSLLVSLFETLPVHFVRSSLINYRFIVTSRLIDVPNVSLQFLNFVHESVDIVGARFEFGCQIRAHFGVASPRIAVLPSPRDKRFVTALRRGARIGCGWRGETSADPAPRFLKGRNVAKRCLRDDVDEIYIYIYMCICMTV